jgi:manganese-transporting P-type ATPase
MITGDNALTACHVAKEVQIVTRDVLVLDVRENDEPYWQSVDESVSFATAVDSVEFDSRLSPYHLCVTGKGLASIFKTPCFTSLLPRIWVYARVSPSQKVCPCILVCISHVASCM